MAMEVAKFQQALTTFCNEDVPVEFKRRQINVIVFLLKRIQYWTPVAEDDSEWAGFVGGHALANWRISMNKPPTNVIGERGRPTRPLTEQAARAQMASLAGGSAISRNVKGQFANTGLGVFQIITIFNNVHYLQPLENGHSRQAPKGRMVEMSIAETVEYIKSKGWWG